MEIFAIIMGSMGGVSAVLTGLFAYFGNLRLEKYKSELQLANAKIKSLTDTSSHISKTQFDKEFTIYQEIWVLLVDLRSKTLTLRPVMDSVDPNESEDDRIQRRLKDFGESFNAFRNGIENNKPFYAHAVYEALNNVFGLCYEECVDYQYKSPGWSKEYWEKSRENNKNIIKAIEQCCEKIRERIESLAVVE
ncbi:hypothetical protein [Marinomonas polaris]|uniref:hypothetical protein n=1 Tax=Marinomonas polaris TaxID=293552 RepID=UPI003F9C2C67